MKQHETIEQYLERNPDQTIAMNISTATNSSSQIPQNEKPHRLSLIFFTTLKSNRLVSLTKEQGYIHLDAIEWTPERLKHGIEVKLQKVPYVVKLFKIVAPNGDIGWVITYHPDASLSSTDVQHADAHR